MKDPAMLFYPRDFLVGVAFMDMAERGQYITLLCYQQQCGHLTLEKMEKVVGAVSPAVLEKFTVDENGLYYNRRADEEINRRNAYVKQRLANLNGSHTDVPCEAPIRETHKGAHKGDTYGEPVCANAISNNIIITENNNKKPEKHRYGEYRNVLLTDEEYEKLKAEYPDLPARIERLSEYIASKGATYKSHYATIRSWAHKDDKEATAKTINKYRDFARRALASGVLPLPREDDEEEGE